jgi:glycosyltransferase involved in cell wall biosynthesis
MRLLILSQYFWPETFIINDIVRVLHEQGHDVVVATGKPNYPDGQVFPGYRAWGMERGGYLGKVEVIRIPIFPRLQGGRVNLFLNYSSFVVSGVLLLPWLLRKHKFDAIVVFAPSPVTQAIPAMLLKWLKKSHLALWVQDLWPESLAATRFVFHPGLLRIVGHMVRWIYRHCDTLLVPSRAFVEPVALYADKGKIEYYPNSIDSKGSDCESVLPPCFVKELEKYFCVVFAGNLGTAQALETLVQAALALRDESDIRLVLVGSGSRLAWLEAQKRALGLDNLLLPGRFPMESMPQIFARSGALLVSLTDESVFAQTIPSKIQAYLAAGRPIVASLNGEGARVVREAAAGLTSPAEQVMPLVENIRKLHQMSDFERESMGQAGRAYFEKHFEMETQTRILVELLLSRCQ